MRLRGFGRVKPCKCRKPGLTLVFLSSPNPNKPIPPLTSRPRNILPPAASQFINMIKMQMPGKYRLNLRPTVYHLTELKRRRHLSLSTQNYRLLPSRNRRGQKRFNTNRNMHKDNTRPTRIQKLPSTNKLLTTYLGITVINKQQVNPAHLLNIPVQLLLG